MIAWSDARNEIKVPSFAVKQLNAIGRVSWSEFKNVTRREDDAQTTHVSGGILCKRPSSEVRTWSIAPSRDVANHYTRIDRANFAYIYLWFDVKQHFFFLSHFPLDALSPSSHVMAWFVRTSWSISTAVFRSTSFSNVIMVRHISRAGDALGSNPSEGTFTVHVHSYTRRPSVKLRFSNSNQGTRPFFSLYLASMRWLLFAHNSFFLI